MRNFDQTVAQMKKRAMVVVFIATFLAMILFAFLVPWTLNTWLEYYGRTPDVEWWQGAMVGAIPYNWLRRLIIIFALITWVLMLFLTGA